jgi:hypothetical protein
MENFRKKNQTEILKIKSPISQTNKQKKQWKATPAVYNKWKDRISDLEDKIDLKKKTEEQLVKQLKSCKWNM